MADDYETQLAMFMHGIRTEESSGNYSTHPNRVGASGAYQFTRSTWQGAAGPYAKIYPEAWMAPPAIQDEVARQMMGGYFRAFGGDWSKVAMAWLEGGGAVAKGLDRSDGDITASAYARKVLGYAGLAGSAPIPVGMTPAPVPPQQMSYQAPQVAAGPNLHDVDTQAQTILGLLSRPAPNADATVPAQQTVLPADTAGPPAATTPAPDQVTMDAPYLQRAGRPI